MRRTALLTRRRDPQGARQAGRFRVAGTLVAVNTLETFDATDRGALLHAAAQRLWSDICDGSAARQPERLCSFVVLAFPDLKAFSFRFWFAFPALKLQAPVTCDAATPLHAAFPAPLCDAVAAACTAWLQAPDGALAWLVHVPPDGGAAATHALSEWEALSALPGEVALAFADPCNLPNHPGWPLRNLLALACARWHCSRLRVICVRGEGGRASAQHSIVLHATLPSDAVALPAMGCGGVPTAVGWEKDTEGRAGPRSVNLRGCLDPREQAEQAIDLNLKLMRWRLFPELDVARLAATRCLLIGAGTLGCAVARTLLGWGVRRMTLVDSGTVSFSNPVRQSLFEHEDCLDGGRPKAAAAAERLQRIFPGAEARGVCLRVPMPGHTVLAAEEAAVAADVAQLEALVAEADVVFILTDTRESRWLPTLLCAHLGKLAVNAALGFDTYLVMRHGSSAGDDGAPPRLGCYFCSDVVAPVDSTANRTLDQQCTVARPGLAPIAAALAVELAVAVLHHPEGARAPAGSQSGALGAVPHQVRGSLSAFEQRAFEAPAFRQCTACSPLVCAQLRQEPGARWRFLMDAFRDGHTLEQLTGLSQLHASADAAGWDDVEDSD